MKTDLLKAEKKARDLLRRYNKARDTRLRIKLMQDVECNKRVEDVEDAESKHDMIETAVIHAMVFGVYPYEP